MKRCRRSCTHTFQTFLRFDNFFLACKKRFWSFAHAQISEYKYQISNSSVAGQFLTVPRLLSYFTGVTTRRSFNTSCGSGEKEHSCQAVKNERNNFRSNRQNIMAWKTCSKPPPWKVHPKSPCWKTPTLKSAPENLLRNCRARPGGNTARGVSRSEEEAGHASGRIPCVGNLRIELGSRAGPSEPEMDESIIMTYNDYY